MRLLGEIKSLLEQTHGEIPMVWTSPPEKASPFESPSMCFATSWQRTPDIIGADLDEQEEMDHALIPLHKVLSLPHRQRKEQHEAEE
jgi:hypothetical protein